MMPKGQPPAGYAPLYSFFVPQGTPKAPRPLQPPATSQPDYTPVYATTLVPDLPSRLHGLANPGDKIFKITSPDDQDMGYAIDLALARPLLTRCATVMGRTLMEADVKSPQDKRKKLLVFFSDIPPPVICGERSTASHKFPDQLRVAPSYKALILRLTDNGILPADVWQVARNKQNVDFCLDIIMPVMCRVMMILDEIIRRTANPLLSSMNPMIMPEADWSGPRGRHLTKVKNQWIEEARKIWNQDNGNVWGQLKEVPQGSDMIAYTKKSAAEVEIARLQNMIAGKAHNQPPKDPKAKKSSYNHSQIPQEFPPVFPPVLDVISGGIRTVPVPRGIAATVRSVGPDNVEHQQQPTNQYGQQDYQYPQKLSHYDRRMTQFAKPSHFGQQDSQYDQGHSQYPQQGSHYFNQPSQYAQRDQRTTQYGQQDHQYPPQRPSQHSEQAYPERAPQYDQQDYYQGTLQYPGQGSGQPQPPHYAPGARKTLLPLPPPPPPPPATQAQELLPMEDRPPISTDYTAPERPRMFFTQPSTSSNYPPRPPSLPRQPPPPPFVCRCAASRTYGFFGQKRPACVCEDNPDRPDEKRPVSAELPQFEQVEWTENTTANSHLTGPPAPPQMETPQLIQVPMNSSTVPRALQAPDFALVARNGHQVASNRRDVTGISAFSQKKVDWIQNTPSFSSTTTTPAPFGPRTLPPNPIQVPLNHNPPPVVPKPAQRAPVATADAIRPASSSQKATDAPEDGGEEDEGWDDAIVDELFGPNIWVAPQRPEERDIFGEPAPWHASKQAAAPPVKECPLDKGNPKGMLWF